MSCNCHCSCKEKKHECCWHPFVGAIWMVIPKNHTYEECCGCGATRLRYIGCTSWSGKSPYKSRLDSTLPNEFARF